MLPYKTLAVAVLLGACVSQGQYEESSNVYFSSSGNSISHTARGTYRHSGPPVGISGNAYLSGKHGAVHVRSAPIHHPPYPSYGHGYRVYHDGDTVISQGRDYFDADDCVHTIRRHGRTIVRSVPCY